MCLKLIDARFILYMVFLHSKSITKVARDQHSSSEKCQGFQKGLQNIEVKDDEIAKLVSNLIR